MEPVRGLSIQDSCAAIAVGEKKLFVANVQTGKPVHFLWTFDLHHLYKATHMGKEVRSPRCSLNLSSDYRDFIRRLGSIHRAQTQI